MEKSWREWADSKQRVNHIELWTRVTISLIWKTGVSEFVSFQFTIVGKENKFHFECLLPQQSSEPLQWKALGLGNEYKTPAGSSCLLYVATTKRAGQVEQASAQMKSQLTRRHYKEPDIILRDALSNCKLIPWVWDYRWPDSCICVCAHSFICLFTQWTCITYIMEICLHVVLLL